MGARNPGVSLGLLCSAEAFALLVGLMRALVAVGVQRNICEGAGGISGAGKVHCTRTDFKIRLKHGKLLCDSVQSNEETICRQT